MEGASLAESCRSQPKVTLPNAQVNVALAMTGICLLSPYAHGRPHWDQALMLMPAKWPWQNSSGVPWSGVTQEDQPRRSRG